jgi:ribosomal protein L2
MNQKTKCIACGKGRETGESPIKVNGKKKKYKIPLIKHHVRYEPELIAYVHFECHKIIHDPNDDRYKHLIQFQDGESRKHYSKIKLNTTINKKIVW